MHLKIHFSQEYSFQITMRQQWNDKRLAYKERLQGQLAGNYYHLQNHIQIQYKYLCKYKYKYKYKHCQRHNGPRVLSL